MIRCYIRCRFGETFILRLYGPHPDSFMWPTAWQAMSTGPRY